MILRYNPLFSQKSAFWIPKALGLNTKFSLATPAIFQVPIRLAKETDNAWNEEIPFSDLSLLKASLDISFTCFICKNLVLIEK